MNSRRLGDAGGYAEVLTWGSSFEGGNGLKEQIRAQFKGGNIGHAAIRLTIPIDEQGNAKALIEKYCFENDKIIIPHKIKSTPMGNCFEVYISAWGDAGQVTLNRNYVWDAMEERTGVHFGWDQKWSAELNPEVRSYKGLTDRTTMTLGPSTILHQRASMTDKQYHDFVTIHQYKSFLKKNTDYFFLEGRLTNLGGKKLGETELLLLERLIPKWKDAVKKPPKISRNEVEAIRALILNKKKENHDAKGIPLIDAIQKIAINELKSLSSDIRNDFLKWGMITPTTAQRIIDNYALIGLNNVDNIEKICHYSRDEINALGGQIRKLIITEISVKNLESHYSDYEIRNSKILDDSVAYGMSPDNVVTIPLQSLTKTPNNDGALNIEAMLSRANQVATSHEKFSLTGTNCSKVTGWVLIAGAQGSKEGKIFNREALSTLGTPQLVHNNSVKYLTKVSNKAKKNYEKEIKSRKNVVLQDGEIEKQRRLHIPKFIEITVDGFNEKLSLMEKIGKCKILFDKFEAAINIGEEIPYLTKDMKQLVEDAIKNNTELEDRFTKLCEAAIVKANKLSQNNKGVSENEWNIVNQIIEKNPKAEGKISRSDHQELMHSYVLLNIDGEVTPWRMSRDILGKGAEGKIKILENERGQRLAIKVIKDKPALDAEVNIMKEVGVAKASFVRERDVKHSKSMSTMIGDKRYVVLPLYNGNEIQQMLNTTSDTQKLELAMGCCEAIKALHKQQVLHRDIKPSNFIAHIDKDGKVLSVNVIDFGGAIKTDQHGVVVDKPFGSPGYFAPELGREEIIEAGSNRYVQNKIAQDHSELIISAQDHIQALGERQREIKGDLAQVFGEMFENKHALFPKKMYDDIKAILKEYNGKNRDEIMQKIIDKVGKSSHQDDIESAIKNHCFHTDQLNHINNVIETYTNKIEVSKRAMGQAQAAADKENKLLNKLFLDTKVPNSFATDIYALGIMFKKDFNLDLDALGLSDMLHADASKRPTIDVVINKLGEPFKKKNVAIPDVKVDEKAVLEKSQSEGSVRLPSPVVSSNLHKRDDGSLSMLTPEEMNELSAVRAEKKNSYMQIQGKTVFISEQGGVFAMHNPINQGEASSTFLVQNLDDCSWSVMKMVKGVQRKIANQANQLKSENKVLNDLKQLTGTLEIKQDHNSMHISIQPYIYGKSYEDVLKSAKSDDHGLAIENAVLMSLKALEALAILHDDHQYLHRDINPQNIMWDPINNTCALNDFSRARKGTSENLEVSDVTKRGNPVYQAPEIEFNKGFKEDRKYTAKTDLFSIGVVIGDLLAATKQTSHPAYQQLVQLQTSLTADAPSHRPTTREALKQLNAIHLSLTANANQEQKNELVRRSSVQPHPAINSTIILTQALVAHAAHPTQVDTKSVIATLQEEIHSHDKITEKSLAANNSARLEASGTDSKSMSKKSSMKGKEKEKEEEIGESDRGGGSHPKGL